MTNEDARVELVIKIPEDYYKVIKEIPVEQSTADMLIIRCGTPLPKGHGRLIDADWLKFALHNFFYGLKRPVEEEDIQRYIDVARSIIEADKAESEVQE